MDIYSNWLVVAAAIQAEDEPNSAPRDYLSPTYIKELYVNTSSVLILKSGDLVPWLHHLPRSLCRRTSIASVMLVFLDREFLGNKRH